tara:strand:+ start:1033 stop:1416 length:384 start_codon:yes stop_codon:yes gene_type:complete
MLLGPKRARGQKGGRKLAEQQAKQDKITKRTAVALYDPGSMYTRELQKLGVDSRDAATVGRIVDYAYGGLTLGVAPAVKLGADEARSRVAQAKSNGSSNNQSSRPVSNRDRILQARQQGTQPRISFR